MWTAGGKAFLNLVEHLTGYLLVFFELNYLSNQQSYELMKFTSPWYLENWPKPVNNTRSLHMCAARGKHLFTLVTHTFLYYLPKVREIIF